MSDIETIDLNNIIEVKQIREILKHEDKRKHKGYTDMFELIIGLCNTRLNKREMPVASMPLEDDTEPILSDHSSDDELDLRLSPLSDGSLLGDRQ